MRNDYSNGSQMKFYAMAGNLAAGRNLPPMGPIQAALYAQTLRKQYGNVELATTGQLNDLFYQKKGVVEGAGNFGGLENIGSVISDLVARNMDGGVFPGKITRTYYIDGKPMAVTLILGDVEGKSGTLVAPTSRQRIIRNGGSVSIVVSDAGSLLHNNVEIQGLPGFDFGGLQMALLSRVNSPEITKEFFGYSSRNYANQNGLPGIRIEDTDGMRFAVIISQRE